MSEDLMSLEEVADIETFLNRDNFRMQYLKESISRLYETARAAHFLKAEVERLKALSVTSILIDVIYDDGDGKEIYAESIEDVERLLGRLADKAENYDIETRPLRAENKSIKKENEQLRTVFEAARRVLRFQAGGSQEFYARLTELDQACEAMKAADVGNGEEL